MSNSSYSTKKRNQQMEIISEANKLIDWAIESYSDNFDETAKSNDLKTPSKEMKSKAQLAYEKFIEKSNSDELNSGDISGISENKFSSNDDYRKLLKYNDILNKLNKLEMKLSVTEAIWQNTVKQVDSLLIALKESKSREESEKVVVLTIPVTTIVEFQQIEKACNECPELLKEIECAIDSDEHRNDMNKFIRHNFTKLISEDCAKQCSWSGFRGYELRCTTLIKVLLKKVHHHFPSIHNTYVVQSILEFLSSLVSQRKIKSEKTSSVLSNDKFVTLNVKKENEIQSTKPIQNNSSQSVTRKIMPKIEAVDVAAFDFDDSENDNFVESYVEEECEEIEWLVE